MDVDVGKWTWELGKHMGETRDNVCGEVREEFHMGIREGVC